MDEHQTGMERTLSMIDVFTDWISTEALWEMLTPEWQERFFLNGPSTLLSELVDMVCDTLMFRAMNG